MTFIYAHTHSDVNADMRGRLCAFGYDALNAHMPMDIAKLLVAHRRKKGLSQTELGFRLGVTQSTVARWEQGSQPQGEALASIARELGLSIDELLDNPELSGKIITAGPLLPVKGVVAAGRWVEAYELPHDDWERFTGRPDVVASVDHRFGLKVSGDSMNEFYPDGTILDCISTFGHAEALPGRRVIILRTRAKDGLMEATCKEMVEIEGVLWAVPRSTNPAHQAFRIDEPGDEITEVRIIGVVVGSYRPE